MKHDVMKTWRGLWLAVAAIGCTSEYNFEDISNPPVCERSCDVVVNARLDNTTAYSEQAGYAVEVAAWGQTSSGSAYVIDTNQRTVGAGAPYYTAPGVPGTGRVWLQRANVSTGNLNTNASTWFLTPHSASVRELGYALLAADVRTGRTVATRPVAWGEEVLVGAPGSYDNVGAIEWYENQGSDQNGWLLGGELRPTNGVAGERFGAAIAAPHNLDAMHPSSSTTSTPAWIAVGSPGRSKVSIYMVLSAQAQPFTLLQTLVGPPGTNFGARLAIADFNDDGMMDLAVGAPAASAGAGRVYLYTGQVGFTPLAPTSQAVVAPSGSLASGGEFGFAMAAGFLRRNALGRAGLAVGVPGFDNATTADVGGLCQFQFEGVSPAPLTIHWQRCDLNPSPAAADRYGHAVAVGNFFGSNGVGGTTGSCAAGEEVAVGIPGEDHTVNNQVTVNAGAVKILPAGENGAEPAASGGMVLWGTRDYESFGRALASDFIQRTVQEDLVIGAPLYNASRGSFAVSQSRASGASNDPLSGRWTSTDSAGNPFDVFVIWDASAATLDITMLEPANLRAASNGSTCTIFGVPADFTGTYTIGTIPWISTASTHTERVSIPVSGGNVEADLTYNASTGRFTMNVDERAGVLWWMNNSCTIVNDPFVFTREAALVCE